MTNYNPQSPTVYLLFHNISSYSARTNNHFAALLPLAERNLPKIPKREKYGRITKPQVVHLEQEPNPKTSISPPNKKSGENHILTTKPTFETEAQKWNQTQSMSTVLMKGSPSYYRSLEEKKTKTNQVCRPRLLNHEGLARNQNRSMTETLMNGSQSFYKALEARKNNQGTRFKPLRPSKKVIPTEFTESDTLFSRHI